MRPPGRRAQLAKGSTVDQSEVRYKCFYANARSMISKEKRGVLEAYVHMEKPDIIGLTETWAKEEIGDNELAIDGYIMFRKDRENQRARGHGAGGVILYVNKALRATELTGATNEHFRESVWCEIETASSKLVVGVCYRPPTANEVTDKGLCDLIGKLNKGLVLIMGDFNLHIDWNGMRGERGVDTKFLDFFNGAFLYQHVTKPTRGDNTLDLIFSSEENLVEEVSVGEHFHTSDHQVIRWSTLIKDGGKYPLHPGRRNYFRADYEAIRKEIAELDILGQIRGLGVEESWKVFREKMEAVIRTRIPLQKQSGKKRPWVTRKVIRTRRAKAKAWNKYQRERDAATDGSAQDRDGKLDELHRRYVGKRNAANTAVKAAIKDYEHKLASNIKVDSKSFYAYARNKQKSRGSIGPILNSLGELTTEDLEMAESFNDYFASVFTQENLLNCPVPEKLFLGSAEEEARDITITKEEIIEQLRRLKIDKSPGPDDLHPKFLHEVRHEIGECLAQIMNESLKSGVVPRGWRDAIVVPIFKKGSRKETANYRPVSLTSIICKVFEKIIQKELVNHLTANNIIRDSQHGFTKGRSCLSNLLDFLEEVVEGLEEESPVDIIYLDFAKAFDKVPHVRLAKKLEACGITGNILRWIVNWLTDRRQAVGIRGCYSDWIKIVSGVPQGSVLGPLLFVIYINDIDKELTAKVSKFADDTKLCHKVSSEKEVAQLREDLEKMYNWSLDWQLVFNLDKCTVVHMGNRNKENTYELGGHTLRAVEEERDLGVVMHKSGKVARQCAEAAKKGNRALGQIKRTIVNKDKDTILRLYKSLVRPHLEYCVQAWSPDFKKDIDLLEAVQRRATKMIRGLGRLPYEERLRKCGLTTLEKRRRRGDLIETYKILTGKSAMKPDRFFQPAQYRGTRGHSLKLYKKRSTTYGKRFFSNRVIDDWNQLDIGAVSAATITDFKIELARYDY